MDENLNKHENEGELHGFDSVLPEDGSVSETLPQAEEKPIYSAPYSNNPYISQTPPVKAKPKKERKGFSVLTLVICILVSAVVGATSGIFAVVANGYLQSNKDGGNGNTGNPTNITIDVEDVDATVVEAVADKVTPSVVGIRTTVSVTNFFGGMEEASGEGSGVIYTEDGYIITNYHVVSNAIEYGSSKIEVFLSSDTDEGHEATVVGYNVSCDLAVIKINASNLPAITLADSSKLKAGQFVVAIGNPGGLDFMGSVTYGVISGLNRIVSDTSAGYSVELIQTDAAINPGNSGGALVNIKGELVGVNSSKIVSESYEGMGFAIPTNTVKDICDKIISKEYEPSPYIGVTISERYDPDTLKKYGYPVGAVIYSVAEGSPADEAGFKQGDIITEFNGVAITHYTRLRDAVADCTPGDKVTVKIYRSGKEYSGTLTVASNNS